MNGESSSQGSTLARKLAITGALITGTAGIVMAVYSVVAGAETSGGALLAASALAFGLLAANVDRVWSRAGSARLDVADDRPNGTGPDGEGAVLEPAAAMAEALPNLKKGAFANSNRGSPVRSAAVATADFEPITARERKVLSLVAEGYSNKLISAELRIAERTVKNHLTTTMGKLQASDRTHAVVTAFRMGWLDI